MKKAVFFFIGAVMGIVGFYTYCKYKVPLDYSFFEEIPSYTAEESEFIRNNICKIMESIEFPEKYYIHDVRIGDTIIVDMSILEVLQSGGNSKGTMISTCFGNISLRLKFDRNGNLLKKK